MEGESKGDLAGHLPSVDLLASDDEVRAVLLN